MSWRLVNREVWRKDESWWVVVVKLRRSDGISEYSRICVGGCVFRCL